MLRVKNSPITEISVEALQRQAVDNDGNDIGDRMVSMTMMMTLGAGHCHRGRPVA
jgi:hypothetical protein